MAAAAAEACWLSFLVVILLIAVAAASKLRLAAQASPEAAAGARGVKLHVGQRQVLRASLREAGDDGVAVSRCYDR